MSSVRVISAVFAILLGLACLAHVIQCNPFAGQPFYVNPTYQAELDSSIATCTDGSADCSVQTKATLQHMRDVSSAYWIDIMAKINGNDTYSLEGILADAASQTPARLVVFIVYDLPNRDCHAKASNGEICCTYNADGTCNYLAGGDCSQGLALYKTRYIDPLVSVFQRYQDIVPIVAVIEPDSLPNLATNMDDPKCSNTATVNAYKQGIAYTVNQISARAPKVTMYLDAGHGGWLGWTNNAQSFVQIIAEMNIAPKLRGFATNVANYQPLGVPCPSFDWCLNNAHPNDPCCADPCRLTTQWNAANNEHNYVLLLTQMFRSLMPDPHFIIDTGRNGVDNMRQDCANWCNVRNAGTGVWPTTNTLGTNVDAYFWLKTPGESDGCTQLLPNGASCPRFDSMCASVDSLGSRSGEPRCPQAGNWFDFQIKQLASNAAVKGNPAAQSASPAKPSKVPAASASNSKAPVPSASASTSRIPVPKASASTSKIPVPQASASTSKAPARPASASNSKAPVPPASASNSKAPVPSASPSNSKAPAKASASASPSRKPSTDGGAVVDIFAFNQFINPYWIAVEIKAAVSEVTMECGNGAGFMPMIPPPSPYWNYWTLQIVDGRKCEGSSVTFKLDGGAPMTVTAPYVK